MVSMPHARTFTPALSSDIPRHWLPGNPATTAILNTYTVLVPSNEAFYMRTVRHCLPGIVDPTLHAQTIAFIHQEAEHGVAHKRYWRALDTQRYRFRCFERIVDRWVFRLTEKVLPLTLRIAMVSCVEHINAVIGHEFLAQQILVDAHPEVRALMEWHFAEEIEHKSVAFDVMTAVNRHYPIRLAGWLITAPVFYILMTVGMLRFMLQDKTFWHWSTWRNLFRHMGPAHRMLPRTLHHLFDYLRPSFHPSQLDNAHLAEAVFERYSGMERAWLTPSARRSLLGSAFNIDEIE